MWPEAWELQHWRRIGRVGDLSPWMLGEALGVSGVRKGTSPWMLGEALDVSGVRKGTCKQPRNQLILLALPLIK